MRSDGIGQAVSMLRLYASAQEQTPTVEELNAFVNLIYQDRLNQPAIDLSQPEQALTEVAERFSDILQDHLALEAILLAVASAATGSARLEILDGITTSPRPGASGPGT